MITRMIIAIKIGLTEILNNKMRSFLSIFAIAIGIFTFLFVFSAKNSAQQSVKDILSLGGENSFTIEFNYPNTDALKLEYKDIKEIYQLSPNIKYISPLADTVTMYSSVDKKKYEAIVLGVSPAWTEQGWEYGRVKGRFISNDDVNFHRRVAVFVRDYPINKNKIRYDASRSYAFGEQEDQQPMKWKTANKHFVGTTVTIGGETFDVIGEIQNPRYYESKRLNPQTWDFILPITTFNDLTPFDKFLSGILVDVKKPEDIDTVKRKIVNYLQVRQGNRNADYSIITFKDQIAAKLQEANKTLLLISVLGMIAMISGGIGIMNVVLATIYARVREIGTRRAIGASRFDIFIQFSFESVLLSLIGACFGYFIAFFALDYSASAIEISADMGWQAVTLSFLIAALTGFLFSVYPSLKAANMNVVDALKTE